MYPVTTGTTVVTETHHRDLSSSSEEEIEGVRVKKKRGLGTKIKEMFTGHKNKD
jgi:hypothetical protein